MNEHERVVSQRLICTHEMMCGHQKDDDDEGKKCNDNFNQSTSHHHHHHHHLLLRSRVWIMFASDCGQKRLAVVVVVLSTGC